MPFDYDLLIIGNSLAGILTAIRAASFKARVALVLTSSNLNEPLWSAILSRVFNSWSDSTLTDLPLNLQREQFSPSLYTSEVLNSLNEDYGRAFLTAKGIDLLEGHGQFYRRRQPSFIINERTLRSRSYLLAIPEAPFLPHILGLEETGYLTLEHFQYEKTLEKLPPNLVIITQHPIGLELAQHLSKFGKSVTLIIQDDYFLTHIDQDAFKLIQTILTIAQVNLIIESEITQARQIHSKKWVQVGNQAIETDEIIWISSFKSNLAGLNLEAMGIDFKKPLVNSKLQTEHPSIYSFTPDHYLFPHPEQIEIIVKNTLFLPIFSLKPSLPTQVLFIKPTFVQIGYTELQAKKLFKKPILVGTTYFRTLLKSKIFDETTGFIKLIASSNLVLVGATILGEETEELVGVLTLAIKQKISLNSLLKIPFPLLSYSQIIYQAALNCLEKAERKKTNNWLTSWFIWRKL